jgi:hypothetical protein
MRLCGCKVMCGKGTRRMMKFDLAFVRFMGHISEFTG